MAEDSDDLWYAYNLIAVGDSVMAVTFRYGLLTVFTAFLSYMVVLLVNFLSHFH